MLPKLSLLRRGMLAGCTLVCVMAFAAPASAGPLCVEGDNDPTAGARQVCRNFTVGENVSRFFLFDAGPGGNVSGFDHLVRITVREVLQDFGLRLSRHLIPQGPIPGFPDYNCVPYGLDDMCVDYQTRNADRADPYHPEEGVDYDGPVIWLVSWLQPIGINPIPEIFHDADNDGVYEELMQGIDFDADLGPEDFDCDEADNVDGAQPCGEDEHEYYGDNETCEVCYLSPFSDPVRVSTSDTFSGVRVGIQAPEPTTAALLAIMGAGYAVRLRRRR
jgi:hypothetical protein